MANTSVPPRNQRNEAVRLAPRYLRYNVWDPESDFTPTTAEWTETAKPLPRPPQFVLNDPVVAETIQDNPNLFRIVTPINVDVLESYLKNHPNKPFVESVCIGLREGFWPWADMRKEGYPLINDEYRSGPIDESKASFFRSQLKTERSKERFSPSLGRKLLPGMYCMPIYAVSKPNSTDFRLVTDQSYGRHSLNSMINHDKVTGYPLDNLTHFGEMLMDLENEAPGKERVAWKSDVAEAYRIIPMHPCWQIKQVNTIDGERYVDRCNAFGGCASGAIFIAVNSLVAWIAKYVKDVRRMGNYVDDSWGCGLKSDMLAYGPYGKSYPRDQTTLLLLWDELGIPHKERKQVFGSPLPIIGISVDPNAMSFALPEDAKERLAKEMVRWSSKVVKERMKAWWQIAGWINWALNAYPLLRPTLNNFYQKLKGRKDSPKQLYVNESIRKDFIWGLEILRRSKGVLLHRSLAWDVDDASFTIYCDACPKGMGFWYPELNIAFYSETPEVENPNLIFYFEALCVLSAIYDAHCQSRGGNYQARMVVYTDNSNTVNIFSSLRALPTYNVLLKATVDILISGGHELCVHHVRGEDNDVADAVSRADFSRALSIVPTLKLATFSPWMWIPDSKGKLSFQPPQGTLGVERL